VAYPITEKTQQYKKLFLLGEMVFSLLAAGCSSYKPVIFPFGKTYVYSVAFVNADGNVTSQCKIRMTTFEKKFLGQFGLVFYRRIAASSSAR
jgi:hypothetical protein